VVEDILAQDVCTFRASLASFLLCYRRLMTLCRVTKWTACWTLDISRAAGARETANSRPRSL